MRGKLRAALSVAMVGRGRIDPQLSMLAFVDLEARVPADHPLRTIQALADRALAAGYADQTHLSREHRRLAGITPVAALG